MPTTQGIYSNRVRYDLYNQDYGNLLGIEEVLGWDSDDLTLARNKELHGIFPTFSNDLTFIENGAEHIEHIYRNYGVNSLIIMERWERDPQTDEWVLTYKGEIDLMRFKKKNNSVSVRFNSGGIDKIRKSRQGQKVELETLTTIDGDTIPPLGIKEVAYDGRGIFLISEIEQSIDADYVINSTITWFKSSGFPSPDIWLNSRRTATSVLAELIYESDDSVNAIVEESVNYSTSGSQYGDPQPVQAEAGSLFYALATRDRLLQIKPKIRIRINNVSLVDNRENSAESEDLILYLYRYTGESHDFVVKEELFNYGKPELLIGQTLEYLTPFNVSILENQSLAIGFEAGVKTFEPIDDEFINSHSHSLNVYFTALDFKINIDEDSYFNPTRSNVILYHEAMERVLKVITGKDNIFYSSFFGGKDIGYAEDGRGRYTGLSHGFWVRGFKLGDDRYKSITTSFKDMYEAADSIFNVGLGIEEVIGGERYIMEDKKYFYNKNVTIRLGETIDGEFKHSQISDAERTVASKFYYTELEVGFAKGGTYEEASGLDEYNIKTRFSTILKTAENVFRRLSKLRGDSYGKEIARRRQRASDPTLDTPYDSDIFIQDLKKGATDVLLERKYADDLTNAPSGVYSPETATNLYYSPLNCLLRHAWFIGSGIFQYASKFIRYTSTDGNSQLITNLDATKYPEYGGVDRAEVDGLKNGDIKGLRFFPEKLVFKHEVSFDTLKQIKGRTILPNGQEIPNLYGLVEYKNENNIIERGYLFKVKPNAGEWEVLTANY